MLPFLLNAIDYDLSSEWTNSANMILAAFSILRPTDEAAVDDGNDEWSYLVAIYFGLLPFVLRYVSFFLFSIWIFSVRYPIPILSSGVSGRLLHRQSWGECPHGIRAPHYSLLPI